MTEQATKKTIEQTIKETRQWLEDWVIKLNLCPFAKFPYENNQVRIVCTQ